jgi:hypothetical protein
MSPRMYSPDPPANVTMASHTYSIYQFGTFYFKSRGNSRIVHSFYGTFLPIRNASMYQY